jgi:hypothetical protein
MTMKMNRLKSLDEKGEAGFYVMMRSLESGR